ncbi:MAG TPA: hypothetical protein VGG75_14205 [Trebonia sp.]|jgi:hypothetical protein
MAPKAKVKAKGVVTPKNNAAPTGLHLSAAQRKAYNATFTASATAGFQKLALAQRRQAIANAAQVLRNSRLQAAATVQQKASAAHQAARTAAIARFAAQQTYRQGRLAHQNAALQARLFADYERHIQVAARLQFAYKGEKAYAHEAVMRTLTTAAATSIEEALFARAAKTAKKAVSTVGNPQSSSPAAVNARLGAAQVIASAKAAALAAARATPAGRTAPRPGPVKLRAPGMYKWRGDPDGYDCVAAAIMNSCQQATGYRFSDVKYMVLAAELGQWPEGPPIEDALKYVKNNWEILGAPRLVSYEPVPVHARDHCVTGFATENGSHAALMSGPRYVISWGQLLLLDDVILPGTEVEEAWALLWK